MYDTTKDWWPTMAVCFGILRITCMLGTRGSTSQLFQAVYGKKYPIHGGGPSNEHNYDLRLVTVLPFER